MKIWLIQANEPLPIVDKNQRPFRTGMLAEELALRNHEVTWFATTFDHYTKHQRFSENKDIKINKNFCLNLLWSPGYKKNISLQRIIDHKKMAENMNAKFQSMPKPDMIYCSFPTIDLAYIAIKYGKKNNVKVIIDVRDLWPDVFLDRLSGIMRVMSFPYFLLCNRKTKFIFENSFCLNSISEKALEWSLNKVGKARSENDYFYYIGNEGNTVSCKEREQRTERGSCILISGLSKSINYNLIIEIAKKLPSDFIVKILGDGPELSKFKELSKGVGNICFYGWCNQGEMDRELKSSSFALLAYNNSFDFKVGAGNKFGQALSYSLPIVVTCNGVMEKLLSTNDCGIYSENAEKISKYMLELMNDKKRYYDTCSNSFNLFIKEFDSQKIYKNLTNYLEEMEKK